MLAGANWKPVADTGGNRSLVGIDDGVGKAAGARHDRHAAIAQAVKLGEAARLEARRDDDRVATALHQMRQAFIVADDDADAAAMAGGTGEQSTFQRMIAGPQNGQPRAHAGQRIERRRRGYPCPFARSGG